MSAAWTRHEHQDAIRIESGGASLVVMPQIGGKIVSIVGRPGGREWLWQDPTRPYRGIRYGDTFGMYDASGFDECFPTIGESVYPADPWAGIVAPDHGELWCRPWQCDIRGSGVLLRAHGIRFPYEFEKRIAPDPRTGGFTVEYSVTNLSPMPMRYLWSAHPLFAAEAGMRVVIPGEPDALVAFQAGGRIGGAPMDPFRWPWAPGPDGAPVDYSVIGPKERGANDKVVARTPDAGWAALHRPDRRDYLAMEFERAEVPYVAVCVNQGAYPPDGEPAYWVALEPCTGYPDRLEDAIANGTAIPLDAHETRRWTMGLTVGHAASAGQIADDVAARRK